MFGLIANALNSGGGKKATLVEKSDYISANGSYEYIAENDNADGYSKVTVAVNVPAPPPTVIPLVAEAGKTYRASDYGVDGFTPVNAVGKQYESQDEAQSDLDNTAVAPSNERVYFTMEFINTPSSTATLGYTTQLWVGTKNQETGEWMKLGGQDAHWGTLYGQGIKNPKVQYWYLADDGYYHCVYTYVDFNGKTQTKDQYTNITNATFGQLGWSFQTSTQGVAT